MKINLRKMLSGLVSGVLLAGLLMSCNPTTGGGSGGGGTGGSSDSGNTGSGGTGVTGNGGSYDVVTLDVKDFEAADTSVQMAKNMAIGWNLGNALDASGNGDWAYNGEYNPSMEYSWLPHKVPASRKLIHTVKAAGFKTIRIPVSWHNQMGRNDSTYTIYPDYLKRVKELVDWSLEEGMCVIINIHHDNLTEKEMETNPGFALSTDAALQEKSKAFITSVWRQVADYFKNYDNKLVFELLNEPRCIGTAWEWGFWQYPDKKSTYCNIITDYEQAALDVIRASGGNNKTRFIMCPSYACSGDFFDVYKLPKDAEGVKDRLIYAVHAYTPSDFCLEGDKTVYDSEVEKSIDWTFSQLKSKIAKEKIGIVMGEASASDKDNYDSRIKWAKYYFKKSVEAGVPVILWDNEQAIAMGAEAGGENHGYFNRQTCKVTWPEMIEAMMTAVYGEEVTGNGTPTGGEEGDDTGDAGEVSIVWNRDDIDAPYHESHCTIENGAAKFFLGDYEIYTITLPEPIDISEKKVVVCAKALDGVRWNEVTKENDIPAPYTDGKGIKLSFESSENHRSEMTANEGGNKGFLNSMTSEFMEYEGTEIWKAWSEDDSFVEADLTNVTKIFLDTQNATGDLYIKYIKFIAK